MNGPLSSPCVDRRSDSSTSLSDLPILPRHIWEGLPPGLAAPWDSVGSGPYELVDRRPGESYVFRANPDYFKGEPLVGRIEVPIIRTVEGSLEALARQEVDMIRRASIPRSRPLGRPGHPRGRGGLVHRNRSPVQPAPPPFDDPEARARRLARPRSQADLRRGRGIRNRRGGGGGERLPRLPVGAGRATSRFRPECGPGGVRRGGLPPLSVLAPNNDPVRLRAGEEVVDALNEAGAEARLVKLPFRRLAARVGLDRPGADFELAIWSAPALVLPRSDLRLERSAQLRRVPKRAVRRPCGQNRRGAQRRAAPRSCRGALAQLAEDAPVVPLVYPEGAYAYAPEAYDGWIYVKGEGILDKRSFSRMIRVARGAADAPIGSPLATGDDDGIGDWAWILGALAVAVVGGFTGYALRQSRR